MPAGAAAVASGLGAAAAGLGPLLVTALAAGTRFWALGFPPGKSFDEVYYATEAQEMLRYGYEDNRDYMFIVHPPLGKWLIALSARRSGATTRSAGGSPRRWPAP